MLFSDLKHALVTEALPDSGRLADLYFDDRTWRVTDLVVEIGRWPLSHRRLLDISDVCTVSGSDGKSVVQVAPDSAWRDPATELPVSRQMEMKYYDYLRWLGYWIDGFAVPYSADRLSKMIDDGAGDAHLRSASAVLGYHVLAREGEAGRVADYVIDPSNWYIRDLVVHAGLWPHVREAQLSPYWVSQVSWARSCVDVRVGRDRVLAGGAE